jgi:hypothetical protein
MSLPRLTRAEHVLFSVISLYANESSVTPSCIDISTYLGHKNPISVRKIAGRLFLKGLISIDCNSERTIFMRPVKERIAGSHNNLTTDVIGDILTSLASSINGEDAALYDKFSSNELLSRAGQAIDGHKPGRFHLFFRSPIDKIENGLLCSKIPQSYEARFLYGHAKFVENHLSKVFACFEGSACSVDKARWVMTAISRYYLEGRRISLNFDQEYTYHLPSLVLNAEDEIIKFYTALISLYFGNTHEYLIGMKELSTTN